MQWDRNPQVPSRVPRLGSKTVDPGQSPSLSRLSPCTPPSNTGGAVLVQEVWFGRQAIEDGFTMMLAADNPYGGSTLSAEVSSTKALAPGLFISSGEWQLIDATGEQLRLGFFANTVVIEDGKAYLMQEAAGEYTPPN